MSRHACWRCCKQGRESYAPLTQYLDSAHWRCGCHHPDGVSGALQRCSHLRLDGGQWIRERPTSLSVSNTSPCVPASQIGARIVAWAQAMAAVLYVNPACGGHVSYPNCYDTWYKTPGSTYPPGAPAFPQAVIQYGQQVCPGCSAWANGTYQCVSFVRGAYSQVYPMRLTANAFDLWAVYATQPGWREIPSASAPAGQRGIPMPGDVMIFKDASIGHAGNRDERRTANRNNHWRDCVQQCQ